MSRRGVLATATASRKKHAGLLMTGVSNNSEGFTRRGQGIVAGGIQRGTTPPPCQIPPASENR